MPTRKSLLPVLTLAGIVAAASAHAAVLEYRATINPQQESGVTSTAIGSGVFTIDTDANTMSYTIKFVNLTSSETAAHIHGFSAPGANSSPQHTLPAGSPKIGVWNYLEGQEADILAGLTYVNIHTTFYSGGEIRGQIVPADDPVAGGAHSAPGVAPWGAAALAALVLGTGAFALRRRVPAA